MTGFVNVKPRVSRPQSNQAAIRECVHVRKTEARVLFDTNGRRARATTRSFPLARRDKMHGKVA